MRVYIPDIGDVLVLDKDWTFQVVNDRRNSGLAPLMDINNAGYYLPFGVDPTDIDQWGRPRPIDPGPFTWPAGTELCVDRVYIRQGNREFSSVTFKTRVKGKTLRFFARLEDVNTMEI